MAQSNLSIQIGKNIAKQRKLLGLTQARLAEIVGLENETISRIESGKHNVSINSLERLAQALNIEVAYLVGTDTTKNKDHAEIITFMLQNLSDTKKDAVLKILADVCSLCPEDKD